MTRMIVEGMDYDNTRQNYVTYDEERDIPLNITLLNTRHEHKKNYRIYKDVDY